MTDPGMEYPLITLAGICHRHERFVIETLESFRAQTYPRVECIIINNIRGDESSRLIREWLARTGFPAKFIDNAEPRSATENVNAVIDMARGEYLQMLSCDDVLLPDYLSSQHRILSGKGPEYCCVYSDVYRMWEDGEIGYRLLAKKRRAMAELLGPQASLREQLSRSCAVPAPSTLYRTSAIRAAGSIDPKYDIEDWPLYLEFMRRGYCFAENPEPLVKHRMVRDSLGKVINLTRLRTFHVLFAHYHDIFVPSEPVIRKWLEYALLLYEKKPSEGVRFLGKVIRWAGVDGINPLLSSLKKKIGGKLSVAAVEQAHRRRIREKESPMINPPER